MAESVQGSEEKGPDLRAKTRGDGKEAFKRVFLCVDDPLEAAVFSVLVEMLKVRSVDVKMDRIEKKCEAREKV